MSIEILSLIDHHHHAVMPRSFDVAELARYTLALGKRNFDIFLMRPIKITYEFMLRECAIV